jgi:hypothetical protein
MPEQPNLPSWLSGPLINCELDDDYSVLMIGARRSAAPSIGAPTINRHLGFWVPDDLALKRDKWISYIENFIVTLYRHLDRFDPVSPNEHTKDRLYLIHYSYPTKKNGGKPALITKTKDQPTRHHSFFVSFKWHSLAVHVRLELIDEYFTISTSIDLSRCNADEAFAQEDSPGYVLRRAIQSVNTVAKGRYCQSGKNGAVVASTPACSRPDHATRTTEMELNKAYQHIYYTIWKQLHEEIFSDPFTVTPAIRLGKIFVDFRGFVASREEEDFIALPRRATTEPSLEEATGNKAFAGNEAIRCVDAILPFVTADEWIDRRKNEANTTERQEQREFTFTQVLEGRCIYTSALGTPPLHLQHRQLPLTYMLLSANHCCAELGQLVDRFHMVGTTRLAALYDLPHLLIAAMELRKLEEEISTLQPGMLQGRSAESATAAAKMLAAKLPNFSRRLAEIEQGMKGNKSHIIGGLPFRVERSHYYQKQFDSLVKGLRIGRIEGFSTYDESVARRLGGIYDLINTVGIRDERLRGILTGLSRRAQTARTHELQQSISKATARILELHDQIKKQSEASTNLLAQIGEFQKVAEIGIFIFLLPDALSNLVIKILGEHSVWKIRSIYGMVLVGIVVIFRKGLGLEAEYEELRKVGFRPYVRLLLTKRVPDLLTKAQTELYRRTARKRVVIRRACRRAMRSDSIWPGL